MGAVTINHYNYQLMSIADYSSVNSLKKLYRSYYNFYDLAELGDGVAASIFLDLKISINESGLTDLQRKCICLHLINHYTLNETAIEVKKSESTVSQAVVGGLKRIIRFLGEVTVIEKSEKRD
jgi:predicted DNA-binding protein YlxM (UPF0122 family)